MQLGMKHKFFTTGWLRLMRKLLNSHGDKHPAFLRVERRYHLALLAQAPTFLLPIGDPKRHECLTRLANALPYSYEHLGEAYDIVGDEQVFTRLVILAADYGLPLWAVIGGVGHPRCS